MTVVTSPPETAPPESARAAVAGLNLEACDPIYHGSREAWLLTRATGIGASEAAAVLGYSKWKSALEVYAEKVGVIVEFPDNPAMMWGRLLEPAVAAGYEIETKRTLSSIGELTVLRSKAAPHMLATLDRIILGDLRGLGVLEIKTTNARNGDQWDGGVPIHYWIQVQHQLAVTGFAWGSLAVLIGGQDFRWMDIERDEEAIKELTAREYSFWQNVINRERVAPDDSESASKALAKLFPVEQPKQIDVASFDIGNGNVMEAATLDTKRARVQETIKELEAEKRNLDNIIKNTMGDAAIAILPNGTRLTWKTINKKGFFVEPTSCRELRRYAQKGV